MIPLPPLPPPVPGSEFSSIRSVFNPPRDLPPEYDDALHQYRTGPYIYTSASKIYEHFHAQFPDDAHIRYADKYGGTPQYWKDKWAEINRLSTVRGHKIHNALEVALNGQQLGRYRNQTYPVQGPRYNDVPWIDRPDGIYLEKMVWHHPLRLAGRVDKTILETGWAQQSWNNGPDIMIRYAHIDDYKTNKELRFVSHQFRNGSFKMMYPPIQHLMDCNWQHYQLQQSAYMLMLEYQGFTPGHISITHYPHPTDEDPQPKPKRYPVKYLRDEVMAMAHHILKNV